MASEFVRLDCIGSGSFGKVWLVRYSANGRNYVLKEVQVRGLTDKEIDQAVSEVKILSHLGHFNIIRYKQAFIEEQSLNIIMEYADGGDMHSKIQAADGEFFEERQVINWFIQISFALKYIHKENILHRDLKTQNIFITKENVIKVGDFGIAKVLLSDSGKADTAIGTPYYLSPEICQSKPYNKKSDIWALGCVLYEMATLKYAFESATFNNLVMKIVHGEHGKLPSHYPFNPLSSLIEMMLQHEPEDRPTADQLLRLPILRPHIARYEQMALKLIEAKQAKKTGSPAAMRRGRKHSLSEEPDSSSKCPSPVVTKKRSQSVDSGIKRKNDLRRSVILKQALTRHSSVNSSTYNISPLSSPTSTDTNSSNTVITPPNTPMSTSEGESNSGSSIDVQDSITDRDDDILEIYAGVFTSAHKGDMERASTEAQNTIVKRLGESEGEQLSSAVSNHMDQSLDDSSVFFPMSELREVGSGVPTELVLLSMLRWYINKQTQSTAS